MEDDLKISKEEYLSNHLLDHTQILSLSLNDQIIFLQIFKMKTTFTGRRPSMGDDLQWKTTSNIKSGIYQQLFIY